MKEVGGIEVLEPSPDDVFKILWKIGTLPDLPTKKRNESYRRLSCIQSPFFKPITNEDINSYLPKICADSLACRLKVTVARKKTNDEGIHYKFSIGKVHTANNIDVTTVCQPVILIVKLINGKSETLGRVDELKGSKVNMQHLLRTLIVLPNKVGRNVNTDSLPKDLRLEITLKKASPSERSLVENSSTSKHCRDDIQFITFGLKSNDVEANSNRLLPIISN